MRRAARAQRGGAETTKRGWQLGDGKCDVYAKKRGEVRAPKITGLSTREPWLTRRAAHAPLQARAALVDSVLADIGEPALEELAEKRRLELAGTDLVYGSGSGGIARREAKRSTLPEHERRATAAADMRGGSAYGGEVCDPGPQALGGCQLAPLRLTRRAYRAPRGAQAVTKRGWELGDGKYDAYAKQRGEVRAPAVPGPGLSTCALPAAARRPAPPTQAHTSLGTQPRSQHLPLQVSGVAAASD